MKLLKIKTKVENLDQLRQRKAELQSRIKSEKAEILASWQEIRGDLEPGKIIANAAQSLLGLSEQPGRGKPGAAMRLQGPLQVATNLLVRSPQARLLLELAVPLVLTYLPRIVNKVKGISVDKTKVKLYGTMRKGVAGLRKQLHRKKSDVTPETENEPVLSDHSAK